MQLDIRKSLRQGVKLSLVTGKEVWCPIQYERLPDFCYCCGLLGHTLWECSSAPLSLSTSDQSFQYGEWLCASVLKRGSTTTSKTHLVRSTDLMALGENDDKEDEHTGGGGSGRERAIPLNFAFGTMPVVGG